MSDQTPLDVEAIRARLDAATVTEGRSIGAIQNGKKELRRHAPADIRALLDENARLNARIAELEELKCSVCGMRVAHLNCNGHVIGWGCADGEECAPEMPRPPAEEAPTEYRCPNCDRWALWTDGETDSVSGVWTFWCQTCSSGTPVRSMGSRPQERTGDTDTSPAGSGRGTGVAEAPETSHAIELDDTDAWIEIEHPLLGDSIETEYLGETNGVHRWRLTNPAAGTNSITFPSLPVPSTERTTT